MQINTTGDLSPDRNHLSERRFRHSEERKSLFLTDNELDRIKQRIRKNHRTDTTRLLTIYGILLLIIICGLFSYGGFN